MNEASLPYAGTEGWSGTETSKERAEANVSTAAERQNRVLRMAQQAGEYGITVVTVRNATEMHHGSASGVLTVLHKAGHLARLVDTRDKCKIYVLPSEVKGRLTEKPANNTTTAQVKVLNDVITGLDAVYSLGENDESKPGLAKAIALITRHRDSL